MDMSKQELKDALSKARENTRAANAAYKAAWRKDPGPRGYPKVDAALECLHQSEANERALEDELASWR